MNLHDWQRSALDQNACSKIRRTLPGAFALVLNQILYSMSEDGPEDHKRLSFGRQQYVSALPDDWPQFEGRELDEDGNVTPNYVDAKVVIQEIAHYLNALAVKELI